MKQKVIAVFDVGKTNKKILLFDEQLNVVLQKEKQFPVIKDDDGFECDNIELIKHWLVTTLKQLVTSNEYEVVGVNFSTYGASLAYLNEKGELLTPVYNYLKPLDSSIPENLYSRFGGEEEFCRRTAGPALGMLNSGLQVLWLKKEKPEIFQKVKHILHFPQYLSYLLTKKVVSEYTSIGCHSAMWDFDRMSYHKWLENENIRLPKPVSNSTIFEIDIEGQKLVSGIGIHDSSASLVPYFMGTTEPFVLISTGTWCINMNPFNNEPLTYRQLQNDCLCYLSVRQKPVKSSRLFMGHIHDVNIERIAEYFDVDKGYYKSIKANAKLLAGFFKSGNERIFFKEGVPEDYIDHAINLQQFVSFEDAYSRFMYDLTLLCVESIQLIVPEKDDIQKMYISGGFAKNEIFVRLLTGFFPEKEIFTSEVNNSSALGAALVIWNEMNNKVMPKVDLGLTKWEKFE